MRASELGQSLPRLERHVLHAVAVSVEARVELQVPDREEVDVRVRLERPQHRVRRLGEVDVVRRRPAEVRDRHASPSCASRCAASGNRGVRLPRHLVADDVVRDLDVRVVSRRSLAKRLRADEDAVALAQRPLEALEAVDVERALGFVHLEQRRDVLAGLGLEHEVVGVEETRLSLLARPRGSARSAAPGHAVKDEAG